MIEYTIGIVGDDDKKTH